MDRVITLETIWAEAVDEISRLPESGRIEIVIYKSNHALQNYEVRPVKQHKGKIAVTSGS